MRFTGAIAALLCALLLSAVDLHAEEEPLTIAVAASASGALEAFAAQYEQQAGSPVRIIAGASGGLQRQVLDGAPYDLFLSADTRRIDELVEAGVVTPEDRFLYASGAMVLFLADGVERASDAGTWLDDLAEPVTIAIANPDSAPYGVAAREFLDGLPAQDTVPWRLVIAENVRQAFQFAETGNVDAAFTARSLVVVGPREWRARTLPVPAESYTPLVQAGAITAVPERRAAAEAFRDALLGPAGMETLAAFGFAPPPPATAVTAAGEFKPADAAVWSPVVLSLRVGVIATILSLVIGAVGAHFLAHSRFLGKRLLESLVLLPLVLPPTVLGYYLLLLIGRRSFLGGAWESLFGSPLVFTLNAAIIAATVGATPIVLRQLTAAFSVLEDEVTEAARLDGASGWTLFWRVHLPQVRPALLAAAAIAFARAVGDFGATLMVAGSIPGETRTASLAIYDLINQGRDREALVLVIIISIVALVALVATTSSDRARD